MEKLLEVSHLSKFFKSKKGMFQAVKDVSFDIYKGETLGMVGESGCGKTTCGRTCTGIYEQTSGNVLYRGEEVQMLKKKNRRDFAGKVQCIFQDPYASLDPRMKIGDMIGEVLEVHRLAGGRAERDEMAEELLRQVGLRPEYRNRFPHEFSGGQRQRIGIARALSVNPEFLFCDEPISALDLSVQAQVMNLLMDLQEEKGLTYLFVSHDIAMVRHISDRIAVFYMGRIVELAEADEVYFHAQHPYTQALLSSMPAADLKRKTNINKIVLQGEVPGMTDPEAGCSFYGRCPYACESCREFDGSLKETAPGHFAACVRL